MKRKTVFMKICVGENMEVQVWTENYFMPLQRVRSFRIPSLLYTKRGTLIAAADARLEEGCDNPNRIDR